MRIRDLLLLAPLLYGCWGFAVFAQEPPGCEKKIYVAPDGKMYIQKSLPLYIRISTSPAEGAKSYLLTSQESSKYSNPFYLDAEGKNTIRTPWAVDTVTKRLVYPEQEIVFEVYADGIPPVTSVKYNKGKTVPRNNKIFLNGKVEVVLSATDWMSGVEKIMYSVDGNPFQEYTTSLHFKDEKEYSLHYYSVDHTGNMEEVHKLSIVIDKTAPKSRFKLAGNVSNNVLPGNGTISLSADEDAAGIAGIYYSLDSGVFRNYEFPLSMNRLSQGDHFLQYYSEDHLGNISDTTKYAFYVDKTAPVVVQDFIGKSFIANGKEYASGKTLVKLTSFDNKSGVKAVYYKINDGPFQEYEKPFYPPDQNGDLRISYYAIDNVGNQSEIQGGQTTASSIPYVDLTGPVLKYNFTGPSYRMGDTLFISNKTKISLSAWDAESGVNRIEYRTDSGAYSVYQSPFNLNTEGRHSVHFVGYDEVDNTNQESFVAIIDTTGPEIHISFSTISRGKEKLDGQLIDIYPLNISVFVSATDKLVGFDRYEFSLDGSPYKLCSGMIPNIRGVGMHNLTIRSFDKLGNPSVSKFRFVISDSKY